MLFLEGWRCCPERLWALEAAGGKTVPRQSSKEPSSGRDCPVTSELSSVLTSLLGMTPDRLVHSDFLNKIHLKKNLFTTLICHRLIHDNARIFSSPSPQPGGSHQQAPITTSTHRTNTGLGSWLCSPKTSTMKAALANL